MKSSNSIRLGGLAAMAGGLTWGFMLAAIGGTGLGVMTMAARVLPWWCGVALVVGSPGFVLAGLLGELWGASAGVAWAIVGYALLRAAGHRRGHSA